MALSFSKRELNSLHSALVHAIDYEQSYIESHCTAYGKGDYAYLKPMVVPKPFRGIVRTAQGRIDKWQLLLAKIQANT